MPSPHDTFSHKPSAVRGMFLLSTLSLALAACSTPAVDQSSADRAISTNRTSTPVVASEASRVSKKINNKMYRRSRPQSMMMLSGAMPSPVVAQVATRDNYQKTEANPIHRTAEMPVATLSIDTDTGSYANVRRYLNEGQLPPVGAVRVEEMINYFPYDFSNSRRLRGAPFSVETEVVESPWDKTEQKNQILKVGIKALEQGQSVNRKLPPANLVFLVDVSGSMASQDKLPLAKSALTLLSKQLRDKDSISIVTYSGNTQVALPATKGSDRARIQAAIESLGAGGSTNGEGALKLAYAQASSAFKKGDINRILMLTDGDFNVGIRDVDDMLELVKNNRDRGISLSTISFGRGNLNDHMMEQMADNGNGNYSYIDSLTEAKKVFGDELAATFNTVASDVKIQIEFNPDQVAEWRLIGYENRVLAEADFANDKVDAGELGAGKAVVALFEITPTGQQGTFAPRRYAANQVSTNTANHQSDELGFLKIRYKTTPDQPSKQLDVPISASQSTSLQQAHPDTQFAVAVAGFAQRLQQSTYINNWQYQDSRELANQSLSHNTVSDPNGLRRGFVKLTELADVLQPESSE